MENVDEKEIQKTLDEMKKRGEEFQSGGNYSSKENSFSISSNLKIILTAIGVVLILFFSIYFYMKSSSQRDMTTPKQKAQLEKMRQIQDSQRNIKPIN